MKGHGCHQTQWDTQLWYNVWILIILSCVSRGFRKGTGGCTPIIWISHFSASLGKFTPGCWKGDSGQQSNFGFRRNNANFVLVMEQQTNYLPLRVCRQGSWEFAYPVYMCFVDLEGAYDHVPRAVLWGVLREYGVSGPLLRAILSLYNQGESYVCILSIKSNMFPVGVGAGRI